MDQLIGQSTRPPTAAVAGAAPAASHLAAPPLAALPPAEIIIDGTEAGFAQEVIEASRHVPVLVDFWATWCGPCKTLTPALEKVVRAAGGRMKLVKIDVDANRALVQKLAQIGLPLQSVPTVAAFWQGQIADVIQGALPESELKRFAEALLKLAGGAMPAADMLAEARQAVEAGEHAEAGAIFSEMLQEDPANPDAWGGLIRALIALGQEDQAHDALESVPEAIRGHAEISGARNALALLAEGRAARDQLAGLQQRLAADADDHQARFDLATALNATDDRAGAADALLDILRRDRTWNEQAARLQLLRLFEAWGLSDPATLAARRRLSALLFS